MKNIKMVVNFNVDENTDDISLMDKVNQVLSNNRNSLNADFNLTNNDVYDMSKINTIEDAIKYRESIVNSYVKKESFLDKFNKFCDANIKPFFDNITEDLTEYLRLQKEDIKNHVSYLNAIIKNTIENGVANPEYYQLKRDFYNAQKDLYSEYKLYKETNNINRNISKEIRNASSLAEKQADSMLKDISKSIADVVEIPNNENGRFVFNLLLNEANNKHLPNSKICFYTDSAPYALNGQINSLEDLGNVNNINNLRIEISHNEFNEIYNEIFKNFDNSNNTLNNIKMTLLDTNIMNNKKLKQSVKIVDANNFGTEKVVMINPEIELTKKHIKD